MYEPSIRELIKDRLFQSSFSKDDKVETLDFVKTLLLSVGYNPLQFNSEVKEVIEGIMIEENICPNCYADLKIHTWSEPRGECFGTPCSEIMSELRCQSCGWNEDNHLTN